MGPAQERAQEEVEHAPAPDRDLHRDGHARGQRHVTLLDTHGAPVEAHARGVDEPEPLDRDGIA